MEAEKGSHDGRVGILHVLRAAAIVVAALLNKLEGIGVPVGAEGLDHVHVAEEEDRFLGWLARGAKADDEVLLARIGTQQVNVFGRKAGVEEALLHGGAAGGDVALRGVSGVDLDELLEDLAGLGTIFRRSGNDAVLG